MLDDNDNAPSFEKSSYYAIITENRKVGSSVIKVNAQDPDAGSNGQIEYSVANANGIFTIQPDSGENSVFFHSICSHIKREIRKGSRSRSFSISSQRMLMRK